MKYLYKNKYSVLLYTLLFSGLGCFSYFFIVHYTDIPSKYAGSLISLRAFLIVVSIFNLFGHVLLYINGKIGIKILSFPGDKKKTALYILLIGIFLFFLNYLMIVCCKWMVGLPEPFILQTHGVRMLLIVWLVQLIMVSQIIVNNFYIQLAGLYRRASELEEGVAQAKYKALQSQLNPHFLFNSLNTLVSEIEFNPRNASLFTRHLSDVYRYILYSSDRQLATLQSEMDFLESYLFLHRVRLGDCITVCNQIDPACLEMEVPPLTLQLLVENVIKHNVISPAKPMEIVIFIERLDMLLVVSNHLRAKKIVTHSGKGLNNLSERYQLLCGRTIDVENDNQCFTVKVPLLNDSH